MEPLLVTVSIPFALRRYEGCAPGTVFGAAPAELSAYADGLVREIEATASEMDAYEVQAVRVVGEMPQLMPAADLARVLGALRDGFAVAPDCEIAVDVAPGRLSADALASYRAAGVTSLVLDVRTTQGREAKLLDRGCDAGDALATVLMLQREGFERYGVVVQYGMRGQTQASFRQALADVFFMQPDFVRLDLALCACPSDAPGPQGLPDGLAAMRAYGERFLRGYGYGPCGANLFARPGHGMRAAELARSGARAIGFGLGAGNGHV